MDLLPGKLIWVDLCNGLGELITNCSPGLTIRAYYRAKNLADEGGVLSAKCEPLVIHRDRLKPEATKDFISFVASRYVCVCVCVCVCL